jgi:hypothetical protein
MTTLEGGKTAKQTVSIVLIEANGTIKTLKTKEVSTDMLHKKCGFRVSDDFHSRHTWRVSLKENDIKVPYTVSIWAKKTGKANFENKYDFPPPIDNELFFGTCAIVRLAETSSTTDEPSFLDLTKETWLKIYEKLFGGFEDIGDEDEYSEDELENVDPALLTAHGYLKDDFVVSDKETIEMVSDDTDDMDTSPVPTPTTKKPATIKKKPATTTTTTKKPATTTTTSTTTKKPVATVKKIAKRRVQSQPPADEEKTEDDSDKEDTDTSELEEEVYTFSDDD